MKLKDLDGNKFSRKDLAKGAIPVLALALAASVVAGRERPLDPAPTPAPRIETRLDAERAAAEDLDLAQLERADLPAAAPAVDPFARRSFAPPAPQEAPAAPAQPTAPPLPFTYVGKMIEDGKLTVFVARGAESLALTGKQKIDDSYRVEAVSESSVTFTFLPLKTRQELRITKSD